MARRDKTQVLTYLELVKRSFVSGDAEEALKQYDEIKDCGGTPIVHFSLWGGYRVFERGGTKPRS